MSKKRLGNNNQDPLKIQKSLKNWYKTKGRDLPWRRTRDPYRIWVSEIMLQQTQVKTVVPYYLNFLSKFPTVKSLAKAPLETVLKLWEGLGYYARARNLHRGAKLVTKAWNGKIPEAEKDLLKIPGIGRSTAGAILSIAYDLPSPILDGNVKRVICRLFAIRKDPKRPDVEKQLWTLSLKLTPEKGVHTYTQAIMDLGAMVCTPKEPTCLSCPLQKYCSAYRQGLQNTVPLRTRHKPVPHRHVALGIIQNRGRVLILKRPEKGLLGGLWGFPNYPRKGRLSFSESLEHGVLDDLGLKTTVGRKTGKVRHAYSHFKLTLHLFEGTGVPGNGKNSKNRDCKWVFPSQLARYPLSGADQKAIKKLSGVRGQG